MTIILLYQRDISNLISFSFALNLTFPSNWGLIICIYTHHVLNEDNEVYYSFIFFMVSKQVQPYLHFSKFVFYLHWLILLLLSNFFLSPGCPFSIMSTDSSPSSITNGSSSTIDHASHRALTTTASELTWLKFLLQDLPVPNPLPMHFFCDNQAAIHISNNPVFLLLTFPLGFNWLISNLHQSTWEITVLLF